MLSHEVTEYSILAPRPPMGWNSWNAYMKGLNEKLVIEAAQKIKSLGLDKLGYQYIVIDDHWHGGRDKDGKLFENKEKFPSGIKALAGTIHSMGLKFGIYSCVGTKTCGGEVGSYGYEKIDAMTFAEWDVDFLKHDFCFAPMDMMESYNRYKLMGDALYNSGRDIVYSICEWGANSSWLWGKKAGGHMWRVSYDVKDKWDSPRNSNAGIGILMALDKTDGLEYYSAPGAWNDMDMLVIGLHGKSALDGGGCGYEEYKTQMSLWCMLNSPLMLGCHFDNVTEQDVKIMSNKYAISINQDSLGKQAMKVYRGNGIDVWVKQLENDRKALAVLNRNDNKVKFQFTDALKKRTGEGRKMFNCWEADEKIAISNLNEIELQPHETKLYLSE